MITKFSSLYAGHIDLGDMGQDATPANERRYTNAQLFIAIWRDAALHAAHEAEHDIAHGTYRGLLHGVPIALKDIFATRGQIVTNGSRIYAESVSVDDATVMARLRAAGTIFSGGQEMPCLPVARG